MERKKEKRKRKRERNSEDTSPRMFLLNKYIKK